MEHQVPHTDSEPSSSSLDKPVAPTNAQQLEVIRTVSRVPGNDHYYEKDGLRTYGDDEDHEHEPDVSCNSIIDSRANSDSQHR
jgi:hypothetical protein